MRNGSPTFAGALGRRGDTLSRRPFVAPGRPAVDGAGASSFVQVMEGVRNMDRRRQLVIAIFAIVICMAGAGAVGYAIGKASDDVVLRCDASGVSPQAR